MPTYTIQGKNMLVAKLLADSQTDSLIIPIMFEEMQRAFCREGRRDISSNCYDVLSIFHIQRPVNLRRPGASAPWSIQHWLLYTLWHYYELIFSERELTFTFAICYRRSVCLSSDCNVGLYALLSRLKFSAIFLRCLIPWPFIDIHGKFYGDRPRGTPPSGGLNARGVAKYSDFSPLECCISETVQDRR